MRLTIGISLLLLFTLGACKSSKTVYQSKSSKSSTSASLVQFERSTSLEPVLAKAKRENKLVFLDFYTTWCAPCKLMDQDVFTHRETASFLNKNFVNYKVNVEKNNGPDLAMIYGVNSFPTLIFVDSNGKVVLRHVGAAYQTQLKEIGQLALNQRSALSFSTR